MKISSQIGRDYIWNTAASLMSSLSIVIMLLVVTRTVSLGAAGVYALAISVGQQFQTLGMYEVRTYQATDVRYRFSFGTYIATRFVTMALMIVGILAYSIYSGDTVSDVVLILLVASLRLFDAFEDVFYSEFQRVGRLDVGGKASFLRIFTTTLTFSVSLFVTNDLLTSTVVTLTVSLVAMLITHIPPARTLFSLKPEWAAGPIRQVLVACLPLFLASFIAMYLVNAPRFAIDQFLTEDDQGYFAILYMPATAINLLAMLVFRPLLTRMALRWAEGDWGGFASLVMRGIQSAFLASVVVFVVSWIIGIPLLELIFGEDLEGFLPELLVLVVGGAFNAASVILYYALTTMRRQNAVLGGYVIAGGIITVAAAILVPQFEVLGASIAYALAMMILMLVFVVMMFSIVKSRRNSE